MRPDQFSEAVATSFIELSQKYGLRMVSVQKAAPEASVVLENATTRVGVHLEIGSLPWTKISRLDRRGRHTVATEEFDLLFLLDLRAPEEATKLRNLRTGDEKVAIDLFAKDLSLFAVDLLSGDFSVFSVIRRRLEERTPQPGA